MATVDQLNEVLRRAQIVCNALYQGMGGPPQLGTPETVAAVVALNAALNVLPEYFPTTQSVVVAGTKYNLRTNNYASPYASAGIIMQVTQPLAPYFMMEPFTTAFKSLVNISLPGTSSVKGVLDATLKNMNIAIDINGVPQSVSIGV